jgi:hypothetical protein
MDSHGGMIRQGETDRPLDPYGNPENSHLIATLGKLAQEIVNFASKYLFHTSKGSLTCR